MNRRVWPWVVLILLAASVRSGAESLKDADFIAIIGDSITEQKDYSVVMESYFLMCKPARDLKAMQFGWSGETAPAFLGRIGDATRFGPTVVTTCYGMNDGGYSPMAPEKAARYRNAQTAIVQRFKAAGARLIVVGSPGCVDTNRFDENPQRGKGAAEMYNRTLAELRDIARDVAAKEGVVFGNVYDPMMSAMVQGKAKYGERYYLPGADGFHPGRNGQLVMAYAFLKALGVDGNIGTISVDMRSGKASATEGHKVLTANSSVVEIESTRYPYCFFGDPASPDATSGVIDFIPFNQDLNRLMLVVKDAPAGKVKVTWGTASKEFDTSKLAEGVNLAAEFLENPFGPEFQKVQQAIREKQNFETPFTKTLLRAMATAERMVPEEKASADRIIAAAKKKNDALRDAAESAVRPVRHLIRLEPVGKP